MILLCTYLGRCRWRLRQVQQVVEVYSLKDLDHLAEEFAAGFVLLPLSSLAVVAFFDVGHEHVFFSIGVHIVPVAEHVSTLPVEQIQRLFVEDLTGYLGCWITLSPLERCLGLVLSLIHQSDHFAVVLVEEILSATLLLQVFWHQPVYLLHDLVVHLQQLVRLFLEIELAHRDHIQGIQIGVVEVLEVVDDVFLHASELASLLVYLLELLPVAEGLHIGLLLVL